MWYEIEISRYTDCVLLCKVEGTDFWCRIWDYQQEYFDKLISGEWEDMNVAECIFDVDNHWCDLKFKNDGGRIFVECMESDKDGVIYEGTFELSVDQINQLKAIGV